MRGCYIWSVSFLVFAFLAFTPVSVNPALAGQTSQPAAASGSGAQQPCVILKRMGPADQVTSHMYSFGIRGKQFQYIEGQLPKGVKFHGRLTDRDVRQLQDAGGKVSIVDAHYTD